MAFYYQWDIGTEIRLNTGMDINAATSQNMRVKKPSGTTTVWTAAVLATSSLTHTITTSEFDETGKYYIQAYVELPAWEGRGESSSFLVTTHFD